MLFQVLAILVLAVPVAVAAAWMSKRGPDAFRAYFRGVQPDGWPRGIQEEDLDHRWGAIGEASSTDDAARMPGSAVTVSRVHPVIGRKR
jgi:hypothetical protein